MDPQEAARLAVEGALDYEALGFRCGLEIHQQLDTRKLFSPCPSGVVDPDEVARSTIGSVRRVLRATQSELGETDVAALAESRRQRSFQYLAIEGLTSLVELDDEPPHAMSDEALDVALTFAGLLGAHPAAEVHVMRKTVIDGSNTSGFQRTALVATGGTVDVEEADVGVWTIAVEEDSARKVDDDQGLVTYTLDRLGVPLIEVATAPEVRDPQHAQATAARIGALLRATGRVRRGLGSIRQDLNVSIAVGDRVEIKGCQDLRAVPKVIENECRRQLWMHHIRATLARRGFDPSSVQHPVDLTILFEKTEAKLVRSALKRHHRVQAIHLPKWGGLVQGAAPDAPRMGREFADHAKVAAGVKGVFHSDELPAYGITQAEVDAVREALKAAPDDAFVLCVEAPETATRALEAVAQRARDAVGPPAREVRAAQPDDATRYMRPLPGAARMYPETDVPPTRVPQDRWQRILRQLPMRPEEQVQALQQRHGVHAETAAQLVREGLVPSFEQTIVAGAEATLAARIHLQYLPALEHPARVSSMVPDVVARLRDGAFAKEAVPAILEALDQGAADVEAAIQATGAEAASGDEVESVVDQVVQERIDFVRERGMAAMGPLMGPVMAKLRGKADGKAISDALRKRLEREV